MIARCASLLAAGLAGVVAASVTCRASAQEERSDVGGVDTPMRAPQTSVEVTVSPGYSRGIGTLVLDRNNALTHAGGADIGLGVGYRISPHWTAGVLASYQELGATDRRDALVSVRGVLSGIELALHLRPYRRVDPWIQLGTGYRVLWARPDDTASTTMWHGFDVGRLSIGADMRMSEDVAIAPMIAADLSAFLWRTSVEQGDRAGGDVPLGAFLFGGMQGRFDIGGDRVRKIDAIVARD